MNSQRLPFWETTAGLIFRWIGFIPCGILSAVVAVIACTLMCLIGDILDGSFWGVYWNNPQLIYVECFFVPFINAAIFGATTVYVGALVAPSKIISSLVLFALVVIIFGILGALCLVVDGWKGAVQSLIAIVVAGITCYSMIQEDRYAAQ